MSEQKGADSEQITAASEKIAAALEQKGARAVLGAPKAEQKGADSEQITATPMLQGAVTEFGSAAAEQRRHVMNCLELEQHYQDC